MPILKNPRHEAFALAIARGESPVQAYAKVYGKDASKPSVAGNASRLRSHESVNGRVVELQAMAADESILEVREVLLQLKRIITFDPREFFNEDGSPKDIKKLGDTEAAALAGIEVMEVWAGSGASRQFVGYLKKYRLLNRIDAIDKALRVLGKYRDEPNSALANNLTLVQIVMNAEKALNDRAKQITPD